MKKLPLLVLVLLGCSDEPVSYSHGRLTCGVCKRTVYEGKMNHYKNGFYWPAGEIQHHKPWDKECVREDDPKNERARSIGEDTGYNDACKGKPHPIFDESYCEPYRLGYEKGWMQGVRDR
jgi:hypothetical protein